MRRLIDRPVVLALPADLRRFHVVVHVVIEGVINPRKGSKSLKDGLEMNSKPSKTASVDETA